MGGGIIPDGMSWSDWLAYRRAMNNSYARRMSHLQGGDVGPATPSDYYMSMPWGHGPAPVVTPPPDGMDPTQYFDYTQALKKAQSHPRVPPAGTTYGPATPSDYYGPWFTGGRQKPSPMTPADSAFEDHVGAAMRHLRGWIQRRLGVTQAPAAPSVQPGPAVQQPMAAGPDGLPQAFHAPQPAAPTEIPGLAAVQAQTPSYVHGASEDRAIQLQKRAHLMSVLDQTAGALSQGLPMQGIAPAAVNMVAGMGYDVGDVLDSSLPLRDRLMAAGSLALNAVPGGGEEKGVSEEARAIWRELEAGRGFTLDPAQGMAAAEHSGYLVARPDLTLEGARAPKSAADVQRFLDHPDVKDAIANGGLIGGWGPTRELNITDPIANLDEAHRAARMRGQNAIGHMLEGTYQGDIPAAKFDATDLGRPDKLGMKYSLTPSLLGANSVDEFVQNAGRQNPMVGKLLRDNPAYAQQLWDASNAPIGPKKPYSIRDVVNQMPSPDQVAKDFASPASQGLRAWYHPERQALAQALPEGEPEMFQRISAILSPETPPEYELRAALDIYQAHVTHQPIPDEALKWITGKGHTDKLDKVAEALGELPWTGGRAVTSGTTLKTAPYYLTRMGHSDLPVVDVHMARYYTGKKLADLTDAEKLAVQARIIEDAHAAGVPVDEFQAGIWAHQSGYAPTLAGGGADPLDWIRFHLASGDYEPLLRARPRLRALAQEGHTMLTHLPDEHLWQLAEGRRLNYTSTHTGLQNEMARRQPSLFDLNERGVVGINAAKGSGIPMEMPQHPQFEAAVTNTPGAALTPDGLELDLRRFQHPNQAGERSGRGGVFYLPAQSDQIRWFRQTPHLDAQGQKLLYGGTQEITGRTLFRRPLFVHGAAGGGVTKSALRQLFGKEAKALEHDIDIFHYAAGRPSPAAIADFLSRHGGNPGAANQMAYEIAQHHLRGNRLRFALMENILGQRAREMGYDGIIGYNSAWGNPPRIREVYDIREGYYPVPGEESPVTMSVGGQQQLFSRAGMSPFLMMGASGGAALGALTLAQLLGRRRQPPTR